MKERQLLITKFIITFIIAIAFIGLENVIGVRLIKLTLLFSLLLIIIVIRLFVKHNNKIFTFIIDLCVLFALSLLTRYVVNYYLYALYMMVLIEVGLFYALKRSRYIMIATVGVTFYHYYILYTYRPNLGTLSEIIFMGLINGLIIFSILMVHFLSLEREKQRSLNNALKETNEALERLTRLEVKTNIARDIHDTFGHDMMALIMEIEMADVLVTQSPEEAKAMLKRAKDSARQGMKTIRKVVETLRNETDDIISESIEDMIQRFCERVEIKTIVEIDAAVRGVSKHVHDVLYRIVQECMTNSIRHGEASNIHIIITKKNEMVHFKIKDDGQGTASVHEGYGLKGMIERINQLNGHVRFKSEDGFEVKGYIEVTHD